MTGGARKLSLVDEAGAVLAQVRAVTERAKAIGDLRAKQGRNLGADSRRRLTELAAALGEAQTALADIAPPEPDQEAARELDRFQRLRTQLAR